MVFSSKNFASFVNRSLYQDLTLPDFAIQFQTVLSESSFWFPNTDGRNQNALFHFLQSAFGSNVPIPALFLNIRLYIRYALNTYMSTYDLEGLSLEKVSKKLGYDPEDIRIMDAI